MPRQSELWLHNAMVLLSGYSTMTLLLFANPSMTWTKTPDPVESCCNHYEPGVSNVLWALYELFIAVLLRVENRKLSIRRALKWKRLKLHV